jgi:uncharacterized protein YciI
MGAWLAILRPPRQTFVEDMTDRERAIMSEHLEYLRSLLGSDVLVVAGPSLGPLFGIVVFEAEDEEQARRIVDADPSVRAGLQTPELSPFRVTLLRGRD